MNDIACPVCSGSALKSWGDTWYRCLNAGCRHLFRYPQANDQELQRFYEQIYYPNDGSAEYENTSPFIARQILSWLGPLEGLHLLDVGCGEATFWQVLPPSAQVRYAGVEFDANAAATAREITGRPVHLSLEELEREFGHHHFDVVLMSQSIEHLRDPIATLSMLRDLAKPDGRLLIATPNANSLGALIKKDGWIQARNPTHFHLFSASSLAVALKRAGWASSSLIKAPIQYYEGQPLRDIARRCIRALGRDGNLTSIAHYGLGA